MSSLCWHACSSPGRDARPSPSSEPAPPFHLAYASESAFHLAYWSRPDSMERAVCKGRRARRRPLEGDRGSQAEHRARLRPCVQLCASTRAGQSPATLARTAVRTCCCKSRPKGKVCFSHRVVAAAGPATRTCCCNKRVLSRAGPATSARCCYKRLQQEQTHRSPAQSTCCCSIRRGPLVTLIPRFLQPRVAPERPRNKGLLQPQAPQRGLVAAAGRTWS